MPSQTSQFCWVITNLTDDEFHSCLFSHVGFFLFPLKFPFYRLNSAFKCTVPMMKGPQGRVMLMAQRWVYSSVYLEKGFHKVLKCEISSQKRWLSCSQKDSTQRRNLLNEAPNTLEKLSPSRKIWVGDGCSSKVQTCNLHHTVILS